MISIIIPQDYYLVVTSNPIDQTDLFDMKVKVGFTETLVYRIKNLFENDRNLYALNLPKN